MPGSMMWLTNRLIICLGKGVVEWWAHPTLERVCGGCDATVVIIRTLQESIVDVIVVCNFGGKEGLMRGTINRNVNWNVFSLRNWSSERGGKSISIESEVDFRSELSAGVWSGQEPQTTRSDMRGEVAVD